MSELARELRALAAVYFRAGNVEHASCCHAHALILETHAANRSNEARIDWPTADAIDDCTEVYADPLDALDDDNTCTDPGDHLWLTDKVTGATRCVHCDTPAMPVYATREAE
jgi:hypothetical protein